MHSAGISSITDRHFTHSPATQLPGRLSTTVDNLVRNYFPTLLQVFTTLAVLS